MVRKITGKEPWEGIKLLDINDNTITNINNIANTLDSKDSPFSNYTNIFHQYIPGTENQN
jgi:hypothetical protein